MREMDNRPQPLENNTLTKSMVQEIYLRAEESIKGQNRKKHFNILIVMHTFL